MKRVKSCICVLLAALLLSVCVLPVFAAEADPATCAHSWGWVVDKAPTCADGYKHAYCRLCGSTKEEGTPIPGTGNHQWTWVVDIAPSRYTNGKQHQVCSVCGAVQNMNTLIPVEKGGGDIGDAILNWIDSIGNVFHSIIMQVIGFFNSIHF